MANTLKFKRGLLAGLPTAAEGEPLFTTDTKDLYIGTSTGNQRFQKYIASGATTQILRGDGSLYSFPLAISSPTTGQVLKYNGTSWVNDSDAGITGSLTTNYLPKATGATTLGNSGLYQSGGSIGLGTTTPSSALSGSAVVLSIVDNVTANLGSVRVYGGLSATSIEMYGAASQVGLYGSTNHPMLFYTNNTEAMRITPLRNLHIGTFSSDSGEKLQVNGTMKVTGASSFGALSTIAYSSAGSSMGLFITNTAASTLSNSSDIWFGTWAGAAIGNIYNARISAISTSAVTAASDLTFYTYNGSGSASGVTEKMRLNSSGNLGLGVTPSAWGLLTAFDFGNAGSAFLGGSLSVYQNNVYLSSNAYYNSGWKYKNTNPATNYEQSGGTHQWFNAPSGSAGNAITFTQAMTLDASGRLGIGTASPAARLHVSGGRTYLSSSDGYELAFARSGNFFYFYNDNGGASGKLTLTTTTGITEPIITFTQNTRNTILGGTSDSGEKLQVNGTAKINGVTTINSASNGNILLVTGPNTGANTIHITVPSGTSEGLKLTYNANDGSSDINNVFNAPLYLKTNNTTRLTLASTGAATFSSSVTAASGIITGNLTVDTNTLFVDATNNRVGIGTASPTAKLDVYGTGIQLGSTSYYHNTRVINDNNSGLLFGGHNSSSIGFIAGINELAFVTYGGAGWTEKMRLSAEGNLGIANLSPSYKLDVTGSARVSDAIAIGTTPDTNNPFKILKNINATVGIKFENTNTSSSAFSAVQLGTDVTGGTKFTNLVYSSSGISASGVYNPDGTSLINNGNGGLNFLGNPIRMYTGGSNGVLRWDLVNDGFITHYSATSPTTSAADSYRQYSADVTAGNAAPHFRTENGAVIKLYQETTSVGNSIISLGGGSAVLDDTTFDGYTLRQIVKALRNQGILA